MKVNCHLLLQTGPFSQYSLRPNRQQLSLDFCLNFKFSSSPFLNVHNVKINCTISIVWLPLWDNILTIDLDFGHSSLLFSGDKKSPHTHKHSSSSSFRLADPHCPPPPTPHPPFPLRLSAHTFNTCCCFANIHHIIESYEIKSWEKRKPISFREKKSAQCTQITFPLCPPSSSSLLLCLGYGFPPLGMAELPSSGEHINLKLQTM